jgi:hypothetical protein
MTSLLLFALVLVQEPASVPLALEVEAADGVRRALARDELPPSDLERAGVWRILVTDPPAIAVDPRAAEIELAGGERIVARPGAGEGEELTVELLEGPPLRLRTDDLVAVRFPLRPADQVAAPIERPREGDRLYRRVGGGIDLLDGTLVGFSADGVEFESVLGKKAIVWNEVAALFVEDLGREAPTDLTSARARVVLDLAGGSRLRGELLACGASGARVAVGGQTLDVGWPILNQIVADDGRVSFLSELAPASETGRGSPFGDELGMQWPAHFDRSVLGERLSCGRRSYARGIGVHAPARLVWKLDGAWAELRGAAGVDDSALRNGREARGEVVFRVEVDGQSRWTSPIVRGGDGAVALPRIDLRAAHELALEVDPLGDFAGDRADWMDLILARTSR